MYYVVFFVCIFSVEVYKLFFPCIDVNLVFSKYVASSVTCCVFRFVSSDLLRYRRQTVQVQYCCFTVYRSYLERNVLYLVLLHEVFLNLSEMCLIVLFLL